MQSPNGQYRTTSHFGRGLTMRHFHATKFDLISIFYGTS